MNDGPTHRNSTNAGSSALLFVLLLCAPSVLAAAPTAAPVSAPTSTETNGGRLEPLKPQVILSHGPQKPSTVPVLPGLNTGRSLFSGGPGKPASEPCYEPAEGDSFRIRNGPRKFNHNLTAGVWYLLVGDRPALKMTLRGENGSYALPALLPGLGIEGEVHLAVSANGKTKWLDRFDSVVGVLSPGSARWTCSDTNLGVTVELAANPFQAMFGFAATATVRSQTPGEVTLTWVFGANGGNKAVNVKDSYAEVEVLPGPAGGFAKDKLKYTRVFVGLAEPAQRIGKGTPDSAREASFRFDPAAPKPYALLETKLKLDGSQPTRSRLLCVWGYADYDHKAVAEAYERLDYKPFADPAWVEAMKPKWFEHWIGRGLEPEKKFLAARADSQGAVEQAVAFEQRQRHRLRIETPDARFDNVINNTAAALRRQFEYPAFAHGVAWLKYGKISCGYYGYQACGYHQEVADSLKFISGTQDVKGRQRYFEPVFTIASWCEEQNFYFVHQVWHHYCWTGDRQFLKTMWPSVLRAIDHALVESDPDGDGIMTGYYEQWNCDGHGRGGKSAIWTGVGLAALHAVEQMAEILGGRFQDQLSAPVQQFPRHAEFAAHYRLLRERTQKKLKSDLWDPAVGAYCSAEWNGDRRPRPEAMEQSWFIWRGVGEPMDNYMAMRYVRESFHLKPAPGLTMELMNDWWPITWSHHYVANGDTAFSVASACQAGDVDGFWPALKSITETAYRSDNATLFHGMANDGTGRGMSQIVEIEPMVTLAVVEGIFGVHPQFGENLLVLRPNLPNAWEHAAITTEDFSYQFHRDQSRIELRATTPVPRKLRVEVPVRGEALAVSLNGQPARFTLPSAVNGARVVVDAPEGKAFSFEVRTGETATVEGALAIVVGQEARFRARHATVVKIHDPQAKLERMAIHEVAGGGSEAAFVTRVAGKWTVFLELEAGQSRWLHPLDLDARERWDIVEKNLALHAGGPSVASPAVDVEARVMRLEIANPTGAELSQEAAVTVAGCTSSIPLKVAAGSIQSVTVPIAQAWESLSPGTVPVSMQCADRSVTASAVNWRIGEKQPAGFKQRLRSLALAPFYNVGLTHLYGKEFFWRHDYTGCGLGIDWRDPMPLKDALGYYSPTRPMDQFEYQTLPEGVCGTASFEPPPFAGEITTPFGVSFAVGAHPLPPGAKGNILALACTEPYEQLPSQATLTLSKPQRLEKIYLLTANLTKAVKCYYPGAEIIVHYTAGEKETHQLIPPYTMSCFGQKFCPRAYAIPFGKIHGDATPLRMGGMHPHLAVTDIVLDAARAVSQIELRCVASETVFGIMGVTLLEAVH